MGGALTPQVGSPRLAQVALEVATPVLPPFGSRFPPHRFTQPQLLAVLCRMRFEGWTYGEACVRLAEHREMGEALGLRGVPHWTTLQKFLASLPAGVLQRAMEQAAARLLSPASQARRHRPSQRLMPQGCGPPALACASSAACTRWE